MARRTAPGRPGRDQTTGPAHLSRLFGNEEGLLLSLRQRWMTMLVADLDQAAHEDVPAEKPRADLVAAQPGLHALVGIAAARRSLRVRALSRGEHRAMEFFGSTRSRLTVA